MTNQISPPDGHIDKTNSEQQGQTSALVFHIEDYRHFLDDYDLSQAEADEFLTTLWNIMVQCTDMGFGTHPFQQVTDNDVTELSILDALCVSATNQQKGGEG